MPGKAASEVFATLGLLGEPGEQDRLADTSQAVKHYGLGGSPGLDTIERNTPGFALLVAPYQRRGGQPAHGEYGLIAPHFYALNRE